MEKLRLSEYDLIIFDSDGTIYRMPDLPFIQTPFYQRIREEGISLVGYLEGCSLSKARRVFEELEKVYGLELSQAFREKYGIRRLDYFEKTWGQVDPSEFITKYDHNTLELFRQLKDRVKTAILTNAPRPWVMNVLQYLELNSIFNDRIWIGEEGIRKPNPEAYLQITSYFGISPNRTIMVGDEEDKDIIIPKNLGMTTVRVNPYGNETIADFSVRSIEELFSQIEW